jgi:hypothetical protein
MGHPEQDTNDPADWNAASYWPDPIDDIEPETARPPEAYRQTCLGLLRVLCLVDAYMAAAKDPRLGCIQVSLALGLDSTRGRTETDIADELEISKQALSRGITRFLQMSTPSLRLLMNYNRGRFPAGLAGQILG